MAARQLPTRFRGFLGPPNTCSLSARLRCWRGTAQPRIARAAKMDEADDSTARILIVGDVHNAWDDKDVAAVTAISPDLTIFVGDIGNEAVELVGEIARANFPKAVLLGNHDSFFTTLPAHRVGPEAVYRDPADQDPVNDQLDLLGDDHIGFSTKEIPAKPVTVVGARPFSWGGHKYVKQWRLYSRLYDLASLEEYVDRIHALVMGCPKEHAIVMVGHNGPKGLGSNREDICGVDFGKNAWKGGDWGDEDMAAALEKLHQDGRSPALVVFGHMHSRLNALVPRVAGSKKVPGVAMRHFCYVEVANGCVKLAKDVWVRVEEDGKCVIEEEHRLFRYTSAKSEGGISLMPMVYDTHSEVWTQCS